VDRNQPSRILPIDSTLHSAVETFQPIYSSFWLPGHRESTLQVHPEAWLTRFQFQLTVRVIDVWAVTFPVAASVPVTVTE
jgi:hypothetical protein